VSLDQFCPGQKDPALVTKYGLQGQRVLLFVGRMAGNKRIDLLVESLARIRMEIANTKLLLVGDSRSAPAYAAEARQAKELAAKLGIAKDVIFTGRVERLPEYYRLADIFVTASQHEGFCVPVIEAMASGVPVIGSHSAALPWVIGEAGLTFTSGDVEELAENDLGRSLKPPKVPKKIVSTLSDEEISAILNTLDPRNPCDARNQTILAILLDTGLRIKELIDLRMADLNLDQGFLKVMGKGQRERIVPIGNKAQRALQRYLFRYRPQPAHSVIENVFLSTSGGPLTENTVKLMFARLARRSGVSRLHAHLCRHTFATRFLVNGGDVFTLQQVLGHSTLEMVRHYVNLASSHITVQHRRFSPLDRLSLYRF